MTSQTMAPEKKIEIINFILNKKQPKVRKNNSIRHYFLKEYINKDIVTECRHVLRRKAPRLLKTSILQIPPQGSENKGASN